MPVPRDRSRVVRRAAVLAPVLLLAALSPAVASPPAVASADTAAFIMADGDTLWLTAPVEVVGSRVPAALPGVVRTVTLLDAESLARLPGRSAAEALALAPAVAVSQRQQYGVQADLSIRGSTFEQVQVLLDGIEAGDPQTGHHSLDLPFGRGELERLEVLRGHGAALYGANAFGGTVNAVIRRPGEETGGSIGLTGGGEGAWGAHGAWDTGRLAGGLRGRLAAERFRIDGDRPGADADNRFVSGRLRGEGRAGGADVFVGFARREFGARDFYAPFDSRERTETLFASARFRRDLSDRLTLEPRLHFRRHDDRFTLFRADPDRYTNEHRSRRGGAELRGVLRAAPGLALALGADAVYEDIASEGVRRVEGVVVRGPALGDHLRRRLSGAAELAWQRAPLRWTLGLRLDARESLAPRWSRSGALSWTVGGGAVLRASAGTIFRMPTFTELYYEDPANRGDAGLEPERGWAWDAGLDLRRGAWIFAGTFFERHERDLIDWARPADAPDVVWQVRNIAAGRTRGVVQTARYVSPEGHVLAFSHTLMRKRNDLPVGFVSKYGFTAPRQLLSVEAGLAPDPALRLTAVGRYAQMSGGRDRFVLDLLIAWTRAPWRLEMQVTNVLDRDYEEIPGVPMPGQLVTWGMARDF